MLSCCLYLFCNCNLIITLKTLFLTFKKLFKPRQNILLFQLGVESNQAKLLFTLALTKAHRIRAKGTNYFFLYHVICYWLFSTVKILVSWKAKITKLWTRHLWHAYLININMVHLEDCTKQLVFSLWLGLRSCPLPGMSVIKEMSAKSWVDSYIDFNWSNY